MNPKNIKPCPFCGGKRLSILDEDRGPFWVDCDDCRAQGPLHDSLHAAREAWDERPLQVTQTEEK